ncbi:hypothetical protein C6Q05_11130 [Burkholderia multivorans]|nr:hypothetical protein C6Q05_11130 [Burkholderia multivorans]
MHARARVSAASVTSRGSRESRAASPSRVLPIALRTHPAAAGARYAAAVRAAGHGTASQSSAP